MTTNSVPQPSAAKQVYSVDWEDALSGNFPETSHTQRWQQAVRRAAEALNRPEFNGRIEKAMDFVLGGSVTLHEDGTATVKSSSHTYSLAPECTCQDSQQRSKYCKHFLAVQVLKRTLAIYNAPENGTRNPEAPAPQEQTQPEVEPWATRQEIVQTYSSCTIKWSYGGMELSRTLRDTTDEALDARLAVLLPRIKAKLDTERERRQAERQQAQQQDNGGHGTPTTGASTSQPDDENGWCHYHNEPMWKHTKNGQTWYSHRTDDGSWCRGK
jgi:hypothetical protein